MTDLRRGAAIVGVHEHPTRYAPDKSELQIQGESAIKALDEAGLGKKDVDALFSASMGSEDERPGPGRLPGHVSPVRGQHHRRRLLLRVSPRPRPLRHRYGPYQLRPDNLRQRVPFGGCCHRHRRHRQDGDTRCWSLRPTASRSCTASPPWASMPWWPSAT